MRLIAEADAPENVGHRDGRVWQTIAGGLHVTPSPSHPQKQPFIGNASVPKEGKSVIWVASNKTVPDTVNDETLTLRVGGLATNEDVIGVDGRHMRELDGTYETL